jgi:hypothetical protein
MKGIWVPIAFAVATALFWGVYGPALGKSRVPGVQASPFKPYLFIGVAYLVWGVLGGVAGMKALGDNFTFTGPYAAGARWGFIAGSLGAFGALCLTAAVMNARGFGGPALVMPIVFGGATLVNAFVELVVNRGEGQVNPLLWVGMLLVIAGIVLVRLYTPQAHPPARPGAPPGPPAAVTSPAP